MRDPTTRFTDRVDLYVRWRPTYPPAAIDVLPPASDVADVGSGTGILTRLLLARGKRVYAVEPNEAMRGAAEKTLHDQPGFVSVAARAEATTLADASVDLVTAAQAWHWFDRDGARREFARILRPGGRVALIWNERQLDDRGFLRAYDDLLRSGATDYDEVARDIGDDDVRGFLDEMQVHHFENQQVLDWEGLQGRCLSSSYCPAPGHPKHDAFMQHLRELYDRFAVGGHVTFEYDTRVYVGSVHGLATPRT